MGNDGMGEIYLDINGLSKHLGDGRYEEESYRRRPGKMGWVSEKTVESKRFNESNGGLGLRYEWGDDDLKKFVTGGQYRNSYDKNSVYAGGGFLKRVAGDDKLNLSVGGVAGGVTGYDDGVTPVAMPTASVGIGDTRVNLMYAPKRKAGEETLMLSTSIKLGSTKERAARIKENMLKKDE